MDERNLVAVSIKHTIHGWKFGMPCWLWGSRTKDEEKRSFSGYTEYPNAAEVYSLKEWQESGYGAGNVCKVDEPVQMCIGFCKKYKQYDTVLVPLDQYLIYCNAACLPLGKIRELKKCPCCGSNNTAVVESPVGNYANMFYKIVCTDCGCQTKGFREREDAVNAWNRRADNG